MVRGRVGGTFDNLAGVAIEVCAVPSDVGYYAPITRGSRKWSGGCPTHFDEVRCINKRIARTFYDDKGL